ncbi:MAG: replication-associated recombination protein A [Dehalococcoidia bacterium]|nr:replication-associated recombination protein A [Dehalococcoidia bacterium]
MQGGFFSEPGQTLARAGSEVGAPLASRMRPTSLDEYVGQQGVIGPGTALRRMIESDDVPSMILWGPPGTGKTTLATIIAGATERHFDELSAVNSGVADMRKSVAEARDRLRLTGRRTILFIDEIHRFNRAQQDALLPHVEAGTVTLIGATTENPSFYVVAPLLSRCRVFVLKLLEPEEIEAILRRALMDETRGLGGSGVEVTDEVLRAIARAAGGDGRAALTILDLAARITEPGEDGAHLLTLDAVEQATQHPTLLYDKEGDAHYDQISAFIKSMRDSDPDGALYWLARMLEAGEDSLFVARRIVILAAEDVGLADPRALTIAVAAQQACHFLGMPEARLPLAEAVLYLARAPKSNSAYKAYEAAAEDARNTRNDPVPLHLRNAATGLMRTLGYGQGYRYAHDEPGHVVDQTHRPPSAEGHQYYRAGTLGSEPLDGGPQQGAKGDRRGNE